MRWILTNIINRLTQMWTSDDGVNIYNEVTSDSYISYGPGQIFTKNDFIGIIGDILKNGRPIKVVHTIKKIIIKGSTGYEYGELVMTNKDQTISKMEILNVFGKDY